MRYILIDLTRKQVIDEFSNKEKAEKSLHFFKSKSFRKDNQYIIKKVDRQ